MRTKVSAIRALGVDPYGYTYGDPAAGTVKQRSDDGREVEEVDRCSWTLLSTWIFSLLL